MLSTLCCMGQDLVGVPFEVFVQIPAQIVKPSQTLRELAGQIWPKPKLSNFVNQCTDWVHHWPLADINVSDCFQSGQSRGKLLHALFYWIHHSGWVLLGRVKGCLIIGLQTNRTDDKSYGLLISLGQTVRRQIVRSTLIRGGQIVRIGQTVRRTNRTTAYPGAAGAGAKLVLLVYWYYC